MPLTTGACLGPYEIVSPLGAGGMGEVYRARDTRLDRSVAIKVLPDSLSGDPQFGERFDREARTISRLAHPNICTLYDVGEHAGCAFLVQELFYVSTDGTLTAVPVTTDGPTFTAGTPQTLFDVEVPESSAPSPSDYAVTADGQRFYVNTVVDQPTRPALTVILNWVAGLPQR